MLVELNAKAGAVSALEWAVAKQDKFRVDSMRGAVDEVRSLKELLEGLVPAEESDATA